MAPLYPTMSPFYPRKAPLYPRMAPLYPRMAHYILEWPHYILRCPNYILEWPYYILERPHYILEWPTISYTGHCRIEWGHSVFPECPPPCHSVRLTASPRTRYSGPPEEENFHPPPAVWGAGTEEIYRAHHIGGAVLGTHQQPLINW